MNIIWLITDIQGAGDTVLSPGTMKMTEENLPSCGYGDLRELCHTGSGANQIPGWQPPQSVEKKAHSASLAPQCLPSLQVEHQALTVRHETMSGALTVKLAETL